MVFVFSQVVDEYEKRGRLIQDMIGRSEFRDAAAQRAENDKAAVEAEVSARCAPSGSAHCDSGGAQLRKVSKRLASAEARVAEADSEREELKKQHQVPRGARAIDGRCSQRCACPDELEPAARASVAAAAPGVAGAAPAARRGGPVPEAQGAHAEGAREVGLRSPACSRVRAPS